MSNVSFSALALGEPIQRALAERGYTEPSPIQARAIPSLLEGRDLLGCAQTGTGKTAAFALPILKRLAESNRRAAPKGCRALILTPTRELASQILESFRAYGRNLRLSSAVIYGGVGQNPQVQALAKGIDILVATPGRLLDLENQGLLRLDTLEVFVLDEADRMLDMGFIHDIRKVLALLPPRRQTLLFSATMPPAIKEIANRILRDPVEIAVAPVSSTAERVEQRLYHVEKSNKRSLLVDILEEQQDGLVLVFTRTKHGANRLTEQLNKSGHRAEVIHGNKSQTARERALENFRSQRSRILVATDIAARGIDVKGVALVVNHDIPNVPEDYVHRIGRTARAGADGLAISLCEAEELPFVRDIQRLIRQEIPVVRDHAYHVERALRAARPDDRRPAAQAARGGDFHGQRDHRQGNAQGRSAGRAQPAAAPAPQRPQRTESAAPAARTAAPAAPQQAYTFRKRNR